MSKEKHSKVFQYKVLNRCSAEDIDDGVENKNGVLMIKMKMVGTVLMLEMIMLKTHCVKK